METKKGKTTEIKFLSSIIQENISLRGRVAILTYQNLTDSVFADRVIIFIEHFQSVILFVFSNYNVYKQRSDVTTNIIDFVFPVVYSASPASFLTLDKKGTPAIVIISFASLLAFIFKMIIFGSIINAAVRRKAPSKNVHLIWQWIFKLQPRVIYYLMAPILTSVAEGTLKGLLDLDNGINDFLKILSVLLFTCEFSFALILQTQFTCTLPTKSFLSSKNNITQILTILQKFANHMIRKILSLTFTIQVAIWPANIITILISIIRLFLYFKYLPAYDVDCLFYQMYFLVIILCLNIASMLQVIVGGDIIDMNLVVGLWIILSILFLKLSINYLRNRLAMMVLSDREKSPEGVIHKLIAAKYFLKKGGIAEGNAINYNWVTLVKSSLVAKPKKAFAMVAEKLQEKEPNMKDKTCKNKVFSLYLEELLERYPQSDFIRLYAAYHFANKQRLYGKCLRTIHELKSSSSWTVDISISVLFHNMQQRIIYESRSKVFLFDVAEFVQSTSLFAQAKLKVLEQSDHQVGLYHEMGSTFPILTKLYNLGFKVIRAKSAIEKDRRNLFEKIPEYYIEPLLFYAHYYLVLNHSYDKFIEYYRIYSARYQKLNKSLKSEHYSQENLYNKKTAFMIFSGDKKSQGRVLHCGGNYEEIFGRNLTGSYFGNTIPAINQTDPKFLMNALLEYEEKYTINKIDKRHFIHQGGFMTEVQLFTNINPFITQGLNYYTVFRAAKNARECILINKDGRIECFTKKIGEDLGLFSLLGKSYPDEQRLIGRISPELQLANDAINYVFETEEKKNDVPSLTSRNIKTKGKSSFYQNVLTVEEAKDISLKYTKGNQVVILENINRSRVAYSCTINQRMNNSNRAKEIYLERIIVRSSKGTANDETWNEILDEKVPHESKNETALFDFQTQRSPRKVSGNQSLRKTSSISEIPRKNSSSLFPQEAPPSPERSFTTERNLITQRLNQAQKGGVFTLGHEIPTGLTDCGEKLDSFSNVLSRNESVFSLRSDHVGRNKIQRQKAFERVIEIPHISKEYKLMILLLFGIMMFLFALQLSLNIRIQKGFTSFGINKEIVMKSEARNYDLALMNIILCNYYGRAHNLWNIEDLFPSRNVFTYKTLLENTIEDVRSIDLSLMGITNSLSETQGEIFFTKDVRLFDSFSDSGTDDDSIENIVGRFSSFQATNQIIETSLKAGSLAIVNLTEAIPYLQFSIRNLMNDVLVKGNTIADNFYESLQESKDDFLSNLAMTFVAVILAPGFGMVVSFVVIFLQYKTDWNNMFAFTRINKNALGTALNNANGFRSFLQQNLNFETLYKDERSLKLLKHDDEHKKRKILDDRQSLSSEGSARGYIFQGVNLLIIIFVPIVAFAVYFVTFKRNLNGLGEKAHQLYFLERVSSSIIILRSGYFQMVLLNNTIKIQNNLPTIVLAEQISQLEDIQHEFQDLFDSEDHQEENTLVRDILFNDACQYLSGIDYSYCQQLGKYQKKASWINLISNIKSSFQDFLYKYEQSNKTSASLVELEFDFVHNLMQPSANVTSVISNTLYKALDSDFVEIETKSKTFNNNMIGAYFIVMILVAGIGLWGVIFPLKNKENKFKEFLLFFPANAILSNFMLKSFLMKISNGTFDSVMQDV